MTVALILTIFFLYLSLKHLKPHLSSAVCFKSLLWLLWVLHRRQQVNEGWNLWWSRSVFTPWKTLLSLLHEWTLTLCFGIRRLEIIDGSDVSSYYLLKIQTVLWTVFPLGGTGTVISPAAYLHFSFSLINVILHVDLRWLITVWSFTSFFSCRLFVFHSLSSICVVKNDVMQPPSARSVRSCVQMVSGTEVFVFVWCLFRNVLIVAPKLLSRTFINDLIKKPWAELTHLLR